MAVSLSSLAPRLTERLGDPLPGHEAHLRMAPRDSARQADLSVNARACREAGVLLLLHPDDAGPSVVLTVRRDHLSDHAGQISFPGGRRENGEPLSATALREAEEEVNLSPTSVDLLGALTPLFIPPSNFCAHPFVGYAPSTASLRPTDAEVGRILQVPLPRLLDPAPRTTETRLLNGRNVDVPYYDVAGHTVWGATAMMLAEFLAVVRDATASAD
ncbi:NUDIX hydrolase [Salinibacter altiplanensis]|uniref:NUDIX hydrolase n=1 Tax=Salinibacter altiplanensis TaxID=1803181 RepID=UPI001E5B863E|nr:CoA pyrophosphatase [Salinibacter altiplanensis]